MKDLLIPSEANNGEYSCTTCGRSQSTAERLIAALEGIRLCDICITKCATLLKSMKEGGQTEVPIENGVMCTICECSSDEGHLMVHAPTFTACEGCVELFEVILMEEREKESKH